MKATKEHVENAILYFAKEFNKEAGYRIMMEGKSSALPRFVEMIVYEMFLNYFNSYFATDEQYAHWKILYEYAKELREKGFVDFE